MGSPDTKDDDEEEIKTLTHTLRHCNPEDDPLNNQPSGLNGPGGLGESDGPGGPGGPRDPGKSNGSNGLRGPNSPNNHLNKQDVLHDRD